MEAKNHDHATIIPVIEEQLQIGKVWQETGRVQISKSVTEEAVDFSMPVSQEEVIMERKTINQYVDVAPPASRYEGDTLIIPVIKEVLVVEKKLMLVEELHISKRKTEQVLTGTEVLRKESVNIVRSSADGLPVINQPLNNQLINNQPDKHNP
jgi:uncharacterized protein (TIGR02271 family)